MSKHSPTPGSVTQLMQEGLAPGAQEEAYWRLYTRFVVQNESLQKRIAQMLPNAREAEPVDVIADAFSKVWAKAQEGQHAEFVDRDNLVGLLTAYAKARVGDIRRRRRALGEGSAFSVDGPHRLGEQSPRCEAPTEADLRSALEGIEQWMAELESDEHRQIVRLTLSGKKQTEIAEQLGLGNVKRVERALDSIRQRWMAEPLQEFTSAWAETSDSSDPPDLVQHFNTFPQGGRWLLRDLLETDLHERLSRGLPVSLSALIGRLDAAHAPTLRRVFEKQLYYDEEPTALQQERLLDGLDGWTSRVVTLKREGRTNRQIADTCSCSASAIAEGMKNARNALAHILSETNN